VNVENDRLLRALRGEPVDRTPVWVMRQAGRYLPEYRAIRERAGDFLTLCKTPELACEVTLQPVDRFDLDAAILFSDILTIPDAMGLGLKLDEGIGPVFERPLRSTTDILALSAPDPESDLGYVMEAIREVQGALAGRIPLIGFSGSPWTLASYMVEGRGSRDFRLVKGLLYEEPDSAHKLLSILTEAIIAYLKAQVAAGVQSLMIFDTWGGILTPGYYEEFSLSYINQIVAALKESRQGADVPVVLFTKGGGHWLTKIAESGCDGIGLDWTIDIGEARRAIGGRASLQGNMDPAVMNASPACVAAEARRVLDSFGHGNGHVFNLGHGIQPFAKPENMTVLVETVREYSPRYHADP
jgi:uroporphyrinogen decarboxylase